MGTDDDGTSRSVNLYFLLFGVSVMDSNLKRGMPVEKVAADVINAVIDRKQEVLLGSYTHCAAVYLRALWISMFTRVMLARSADERHIKKTS